MTKQGAQRLSPFPPVEELIQYCLKLLCDPADKERYFVTFEKGDSTVLVINNYGGMSNLELGALTDETLTQLGESNLERNGCPFHISKIDINRRISVSLNVGHQARQDTHRNFRDFSKCTRIFYLTMQPLCRLEGIKYLRRRASGTFRCTNNSCWMAEFNCT